MNVKLRRRLDLLEKNTHVKRTTAMETITAAALRAMSDEELKRLRQLAGRDAPFSGCTPEEKGALERYEAEYAAATLRITGQPHSKLGATACSMAKLNNR
jgi:hypothetical protein